MEKDTSKPVIKNRFNNSGSWKTRIDYKNNDILQKKKLKKRKFAKVMVFDFFLVVAVTFSVFYLVIGY